MHRLLIVDDQREMLTALEMALGSDFEIRTAPSAEAAILEASAFQPDLVLTDYKMCGLNGLELAAGLNRMIRPPVVVLFSSVMNQELREQAARVGVIRCFEKPFDLNVLRDALLELKV